MENPVEIIGAKRDGIELTPAQIKRFIASFVSGKLADYQMSVFLMAVYL